MRARRLLLAFFVGLFALALPLGEGHAEKHNRQGQASKNEKSGKSKKGDKRASRVKHEVIPGETLTSIADDYGVKVGEIQGWNRMEGVMIHPGQTLVIYPRKQPRTRVEQKHTVKKGENFASIAKKHDVDIGDLIAWNRRVDPKRLKPGTALTIYKPGPENLSSSAGTANQGRVSGAQQLSDGLGYVVRSPNRAWGTSTLVGVLQDSFARTRRKFPRAHDLVVGDLSYQKGGFMAPHKSHQSGRDADVSYFIKEGIDGVRFQNATPANIDAQKTWFLFETLLATGKIQYIFVEWNLQKVLYEQARKDGKSKAWLDEVFQYPRSKHHPAGIIRWSRGHDDHWHIRVKCRGDDDACR